MCVFQTIFYKACIPSCVVTEVSVLLSPWLASDLTKISLSVWLQKGVPGPLNLLLDAVGESCCSLREQKSRRTSAPAPQDSTLQSTLTEPYNPKFGRQGPHCLPYHQPAASRMWAAVPTATAGLSKGGW